MFTRRLHNMALRPLRRTFAAAAARQGSLPASFYRGGTSKALIFQRDHLPADRKEQDAVLLAAMGSPDPNGRQLDGMGGGYSSVSKVLIVGRSDHPDADVDYTFAQVLVDQPVVDFWSNCGNMLAAVGPYALEHSLVDAAPDGADSALVRIHNTNTGKIIHATFPVAGPRAADLSGEFGIDGVAGTHARITLDFVSPEGSRTGKLFPTGERAEELQLPNGSVRTTLMDCGNPCVFVRAEDLGVDPYALPAELEAHDGGKTLARLNDIRNAAAVRMGLVDSLDAAAKAKSVPKVCVMSPKADHKVLSGATLRADDTDVVTRCISSGDPHRALPITASLCAAAAAQIEGTVVHDCLSGPRVSQGVIIGHASGTIEVDADVAVGDNGKLRVPKARVFRTARKLFEGNVFF